MASFPSSTEVVEPSDPRLEPFRVLRRPPDLVAAGLFAAEGRRVVRTALALGVDTHGVLAERAAAEALADVLPMNTLVLSRAAMLSVGGHRYRGGVVGLFSRPSPRPLALGPGPQVWLGLDAITDPDNVGSAFRSALALGASGVVLGPRTADPLYRKALRTAVGAPLRLPWSRVGAWSDGRIFLEQGFEIWALCPEADTILEGELPNRLLFVLGNEGVGLGLEARALATRTVRIPMVGHDSLNVAVAGAVALWAWRARRA